MADREILDLDAFRALYPWPEQFLRDRKPMEWLWHFDLAADRDTLWGYLADTSRFNRALELGEMKFEERDGVLHGESRNAGFRQVWIEEPWDWVAGRSLQNVRVYSRGLGHCSRGVFHLVSLGENRARFYVYFSWIPRNFLSAFILRFGIPRLKSDFQRVLDKLVQEIADADERLRPLALQSPDAVPTHVSERIRSIQSELGQLMGIEAKPRVANALDELVRHVTTGDPLELYRIQLKPLARHWGIDEADLLRLFLHATRQGLLQLSWDVICPHCRGVREEARNLGDIPRLGECEVCEIDFSTDKASSIEITFHVHPSIRDIPKQFYCSAEPALKEHVRIQRRLAPGESCDIETSLQAGRYRLRLKGEERYRFLDVKAGPESQPVSWRGSASNDLEGPIEPTLALVNDTDREHLFVVENAHWSDMALRPAELFNLQEFRDLFSEEYLAADIQLDVGEQTILFTDMVGSTRFYATRGDPEAFVEIKKHFTEIYEIVDRYRGAVVKTIGDAVMAAFGNPLDAVKAAGEIHQCYHHDRDDTPIRLRISLNTGPCIAVNLHANIDYFGGTVNLAAKLQACAEAGEIAMSARVVSAPGVSEYLAEVDARLEEISFQPRALEEALAVTRWSVFADTGGRKTNESR